MSLLPKPDSCRGCPGYQTGVGFVPDEIREQAPVLLMAQNPGQSEERGQRITGWSRGAPLMESCAPGPMLGPTGYQLNTRHLPQAGLTREDCSLGNVLRCRWKNSNDMPPPTIAREMISHCQRVHGRIPEGTKLVVALGGPAAWALTGKCSLSEKEHDDTRSDESGNTLTQWRGYLAPLRPPYVVPSTHDSHVYTPPLSKELPVLIVHHPAYLFKFPMAKLPAKHDWSKIPAILKGRWPDAPPEINTVSHASMWTTGSAYDTEYDRHTKALHRYQLCTPERMVYVIEKDTHDASLVPTHELALVGQNLAGSWDLRHGRTLGVQFGRLDDLMYKHAVLWPGYPHNLNYLGSLYGRTNRWKHLAHTNPILYAGTDVYETHMIDHKVDKMLDADPPSRHVYETKMRPLIELIDASSATRGLRVDVDEAKRLAVDLERELGTLDLEARAEVGWPINLGSNQQVAHQLYAIEGIHVPARRHLI